MATDPEAFRDSQALTAQATIEQNVVFNIPRAAINFNDGFGGGATMRDNLLFVAAAGLEPAAVKGAGLRPLNPPIVCCVPLDRQNTCRESSDHGAFNSWDRLPYVTDIADGVTPSTIPAFNRVHRNFIVANYAADGGCLDNDDGSSYYRIYRNFCVYGGHKSDFDGHSKLSYENLHVYPSVYGLKCVGELQAFPRDGFAEGYYNNTCILPQANATYLRLSDGGCRLWNSSEERSALARKQLLGNNTVYVPGGEATVSCGRKTIGTSDFLGRGYDAGTRVFGVLPSNDTIIRWARGLLEMDG